jgi:hypothetical protein
MVSLVSAAYPDGISVATSGTHWDARAAVVNSAPVRFWHGETGADAGVNGVVGAGITPKQGLRLGAAAAWGDLTRGPAGRYTTVNVEGDYSFGYTRISGEVTRDHFELVATNKEAWGWTLQAEQALTPRVFVHGRATAIHAPVPDQSGRSRTEAFRSLDTTIGYRVDPDVTVRFGYSAVASWGRDADHQVAASIIWSRRWW